MDIKYSQESTENLIVIGYVVTIKASHLRIVFELVEGKTSEFITTRKISSV
jgi:hypothetical protein